MLSLELADAQVNSTSSLLKNVWLSEKNNKIQKVVNAELGVDKNTIGSQGTT
jgi:hypothetical protein